MLRTLPDSRTWRSWIQPKSDSRDGNCSSRLGSREPAASIQGGAGCAFIDRSLCQTRAGLVFKGAKTERPRDVKLPAATMPILERHRERQNEYRAQFGPRYRADLDLIFANSNGTPLKPNSVSGTVSRICKKAGV